MSTFTTFGVPARLTEILASQGITDPTPIQAATLPDSLGGRDVLGRGRTGSGKSYAFLLPLVTKLADGPKPRRSAPRALVLAPTRELVGQLEEALAPLARAMGLTTRTVFGGVGQNPQVTALAKGVDIVLACPGRLEDLIAQGHADLGDIEVTVLDEADHMADLGFLPAVRRLLKQTPKDSQRLLFSATLDKGIDVLVKQFLHDPVTHEADSAQSPVATMHHHVLHIERDHRLPILTDLVSAPGRTVVFTRTKHGAKGLTRQLNRNGVPAVELHGNLGQNARTRNMEAFHDGRATVLVATDIAARGIHVDDVTLVVHADPPAEHKAYLHRSGRTARAGNEGTVITLMTSDQKNDVRDLTRAAGIKPTITRVDSAAHPILTELAPGERSRPGELVFAPAPSGGGSSTGANAQRKRARRAAGEPARQPQGQRSTRSAEGRPGDGEARSGQPSRNRRRRSNGSGAAGAAGGRPQSGSAPKSGSKPAGKQGGQGQSSSRPRRSGAASGSGRGGHSAASFSSGRR